MGVEQSTLEQGAQYYRYDAYKVIGASSDLSHILFTSAGHDELYEWTGERAQFLWMLIIVANNRSWGRVSKRCVGMR